MRRLNLVKKSRSALNRESGAGLSPGAIIARAAATVPDNHDADDAAPRRPADSGAALSRPPIVSSTPVEPPVRKNRRARRRALRLVAEQLQGRGRTFARAALLIVLFGFPIWIWQSGRLDTAVTAVDEGAANAGERFRSALGLRLEHIYVAGRERTTRRALSAVLGLDRGAPLTGIDITALRKRLRTLPWIGDVSIERRWPNVLFIRVREHRAIARFRSATNIQLVSSSGTVIAVPAQGEHRTLLLVSGAGAAEKTDALLRILRSRPTLANRVVSAKRQGKRRWDIRFDNGAYLMLPERRPDAAWTRFSDLNRTHKLLAKGAVGFDMRFRFEFVIKTPGSGASDTDTATDRKGDRG